MMSKRIHRTLNKGVSKTWCPGLSFFLKNAVLGLGLVSTLTLTLTLVIVFFDLRECSLLLAPLRDENK